jgi:hypothetical protein
LGQPSLGQRNLRMRAFREAKQVEDQPSRASQPKEHRSGMEHKIRRLETGPT